MRAVNSALGETCPEGDTARNDDVIIQVYLFFFLGGGGSIFSFFYSQTKLTSKEIIWHPMCSYFSIFIYYGIIGGTRNTSCAIWCLEIKAVFDYKMLHDGWKTIVTNCDLDNIIN